MANGDVINDSTSWAWNISIVPLVAFFVLFIVQLQVRYDEKGINYRFFPFQLQYQFRSWEEMEAAYVRTYKPFSEYGGWGVRIWHGKAGFGYTISGDKGLQIVYKNGKRFLLGTKKQDELNSFMNEVYKKGLVKDVADNSDTKDRY